MRLPAACPFLIIQPAGMLSILFLFIFSLALAGCGQPSAPPPAATAAHSAAFPVTITNYDTAENPLTYTYYRSPLRVTITHPGATELLLELGLENHVLATVAPYGPPLRTVAEKYSRLAIMPARYAPTPEELLKMQPDMIIGWAHHFSDGSLGDVRTWHERGIATFIMPSSLVKTKPTLDNTVYSLLADIGRIFAVEDKTTRLIKDYQARIARVEQSVRGIAGKKTVMVLQDQGNGQFILYDNSYLISTMITLAGGKHIADNVLSAAGAETVLAYDPDFIIFVSFSKSSTEELTDAEAVAHLRQLDELTNMRAILSGSIINLPFFTVNNGGVRTVDAVEKIARRLYPEAVN
ncbi:hypothetical protein SATMO3_58900 [Sporomusa aerivorans]